MKKKLLSLVPWGKFKKEALNALNVEDKVKYGMTVTVKHLEATKDKKEKTLVLTFFSLQEKNVRPGLPEFRVFIVRDDYITEYPAWSSQSKWKTGRLETILGWQWEQKVVFLEQEEEKINKFLKMEGNPLENIHYFQKNILSARYLAKEIAEEKAVELEMEGIPPIPEDFPLWAEKVAMVKSRYIYYHYRNGTKEQNGFCTHCYSDVLVIPKHNDVGECPICQKKVQFKTVSRTSYLIDNQELAMMQPFKEGFIVRYFWASKRYRSHIQTSFRLTERYREVYVDGQLPVTYEHRRHPTLDKFRWFCGGKDYFFASAVLYPQNVAQVLQGTRYQYSALEQFAQRNEYPLMCVYRYLQRYLTHPFIEYLTKLKLFNLVEEVVACRLYSRNLCLGGGNLREILAVGKDRVPLLQELDVSDALLGVIQEMDKRGIVLTADEIRNVLSLMGYRNFIEMLQFTKYGTVKKISKYLLSQSKKKDEAFPLWKDYLVAAQKLGYPLEHDFTVFPRNLKETHDLAVGRIAEQKRREQRENRKEIESKTADYLEALNRKFFFEKDKFFMTAPKKLLDLVKEGCVLKHCVGGHYVEDMAEGLTVILFIRRKEQPDHPFFTVEVQGTEVVQCYGFEHNTPTEEVAQFIQDFEAAKLNIATKKVAV